MNNETKKLDHDTASAREREITDATDWLEKTLEANGGECLFDDLLDAADANGYNVKQIRNAAKHKTTYPRIMQRWTEADPLKTYWCLENTWEAIAPNPAVTPRKIDYDAYAVKARERMEKIINILFKQLEATPSPQLADMILKAQKRLDYYADF